MRAWTITDFSLIRDMDPEREEMYLRELFRRVNMFDWCNGSTSVSKTEGMGSIPISSANYKGVLDE